MAYEPHTGAHRRLLRKSSDCRDPTRKRYMLLDRRINASGLLSELLLKMPSKWVCCGSCCVGWGSQTQEEAWSWLKAEPALAPLRVISGWAESIVSPSSVFTQTVASQGPVRTSAPSIMSFFQELIKNCGQLMFSAFCTSWWHALAAIDCFMRWQAQNQRQTQHLCEPQVISVSEMVRTGQPSVPSSLLGSGIPKLSCLAIHLFSKYQLSDPGPALGNSGFPSESTEGATRPRKVPGEVCGSGTRKPNSSCLPWNIQFHPLLSPSGLMSTSSPALHWVS